MGEIFRFNGQLLDVAAGLSAHLGITPTHWQTMAVIRNEPMTVSDISRRVGLRRQSVQHTTRQLAARGLVRLARNPRHVRAPLVALTRRGQQMMRQLLRLQVALTERFCADLTVSEHDLERTAQMLRDMRARSAAAGTIGRPTRPAGQRQG